MRFPLLITIGIVSSSIAVAADTSVGKMGENRPLYSVSLRKYLPTKESLQGYYQQRLFQGSLGAMKLALNWIVGLNLDRFRTKLLLSGSKTTEFVRLLAESQENDEIKRMAPSMIKDDSLTAASLQSLRLAHDKLLIWAAENGFLELVKVLLGTGQVSASEIQLAILAASIKGHLDIIEYLITKTEDPDIFDGLALRLAAHRVDIETMTFLINNQFNWRSGNDYVYQKAVENDLFELIKVFSRQNDFDNNKFLIRAAELGNARIAKYLMRRCRDPLRLIEPAIRRGLIQIVDAYVQEFDRLKVEELSHILKCAIYFNQPNIVGLIIEKSDVHLIDISNLAVFSSVKQKNYEILNMLIQRDALCQIMKALSLALSLKDFYSTIILLEKIIKKRLSPENLVGIPSISCHDPVCLGNHSENVHFSDALSNLGIDLHFDNERALLVIAEIGKITFIEQSVAAENHGGNYNIDLYIETHGPRIRGLIEKAFRRNSSAFYSYLENFIMNHQLKPSHTAGILYLTDDHGHVKARSEFIKKSAHAQELEPHIEGIRSGFDDVIDSFDDAEFESLEQVIDLILRRDFDQFRLEQTIAWAARKTYLNPVLQAINKLYS